LIDFAVTLVSVVEALPGSKAGNHIANPLIRSGTSPAPNDAEAQSAASRNDFVHKMKISLKELRETLVWLKIQNSGFDLAFDNGASKSDSLTVGCGQKCHASNKCYHASSNRRVGG